MAEASSPAGERVCVGVIVGAHGIRGHVRVKSFTDEPTDVAAYGPVWDDTGRRSFVLEVIGQSKGVVLCAIEGASDRNAAEALKNVRLYVDRERLPPTEDEEEFYHADLIGLTVELSDGTVLGTIAAVYDFGAGDVLEVRGEAGGSVMLPFTREAVPVVDLAGRRVVAEKLPGLVEGPPGRQPSGESPVETAGVSRGRKARVGKRGAVAEDVPADEWPDEDWH